MRIAFFLLITLGLLSSTCGSGNGINLFSIEDDIALGKQLRDQVLSSGEYNVLSRSQYPQSYAYLDNMVNSILNSGDIRYKDEFAWEVYILEDETLNAFAAPGGYIFVYTGLIKFLDRPDDLAGVMAHEVAHADRRHSTDQLTRRYGISALAGIVLGENAENIGTEILSSLVSLRFGRSDESEADAFSVNYLCDTKYAANGAASFFEKMTQQNTVGVPEFLSTHPSPQNRVAEINQLANQTQCSTNASGSVSAWQSFQRSLP
ncbi:MAG: M48 family metalloprotease [Bacteroidota bacterium]